MKVLFICYPHVGINKGGMYIQIQKTAEALRQCGVEVVFQNPWENQIADCDICHVFSTQEGVHGIMRAAISLGKPTVWSAVLSVFAKPMWILRTQVSLSHSLPGFYTAWKGCRYLASACSHVIALNPQEEHRLQTLFPAMKGKISVIPNGIDLSFRDCEDAGFRRHVGLGLQDRYVLHVGNVCPNKNQLNLIRAAKGQAWNLVLVGPLDQSPYTKQCLEEADSSSNVFIIGSLPYGSELLKGAYAGAEVFCLPSFSEVQPLTLIEAAIAGCKLVASDQVPIMDCLNGHVFVAPPNNVSKLQSAITKAFLTPATARDVILKQPSWKDVGAHIATIYAQLCK